MKKTGKLMVFIIILAVPFMFAQFTHAQAVSPDTDIDGDGLTGSEEASWGTDELNADTDGDGLLGGEEVYGFFRTDPLDFDTDDDGLSDGLEMGRSSDYDPSTQTNPLDPDTDGDGLCDGSNDVYSSYSRCEGGEDLNANSLRES